MAARPDPCDPRRLDRYLHERFSPRAEGELESHLIVCPACRSKLDQLAGGARWWTEVRRYLGSDGARETSGTAFWADAAALQTGGPVDLGFLQPSAHPTALGRLGDYEVIEVLGRGGMGVVLKAFDPALHRPVAIKVLAGEYAASAAARKRFAREAQAAAAVVHDHVVPVYAVNATAVPPYLVMALIGGQSLQERIDRTGPLELKEILRIGFQTAAGLAAAHAQGLVHRDIKPANIMLENGVERVRITDFGLARAVDDVTITQTGMVAGTPQYMAPEQARGEPVDQRADLFALGSVIYAMATGHAPFRGNSTAAVLRQVCDVEPAPMRTLHSDVPTWLQAIVGKLHAKDPAKRFASASVTADLLEQCLAHVQQPGRQPLPAAARQLRAARQSIGIRSLATLAGALIVALGAGLLLWPRGPVARAPVVGSTPPHSGSLRDLFPEEAERVRTRLNELERSLAELPDDATLSVDVGNLARRLGTIRGQVSQNSAEGDGVADRLRSLRARMNRLEEGIRGKAD